MPNLKTLIPFAGTKEQEDRLREVIAKHKGELGATMPIMQEAQEI
ncbi:MAG TPA: NAD(P)H-dependent oxidoreductase subunit E, partial [Anaerovoracaceae bacterium]|nr:NAD(P)H-dependent oxidoreductase subunit E [Anaerovoracaceae bacterium]